MSRFSALLALTGLLTLGGPLQAASFNCSKASTYQEDTICQIESLSRLDDQLSTVFKGALAVSEDPEGLKSSQRGWLLERDQCFNEICLRQAMVSRIEALERQIAKAQPAPSSDAAVSRTDLAVPQPSSDQPPISYTPEATIEQTPSATEDQEYSYSSNLPQSNHQSEKMPLALKIFLVVIAVVSLVSIYLHHQGRLTIYQDYTDATFTSLIPLLSIGLMWLLAWLEVPAPYGTYCGYALAILMIAVVLRATYQANGFSLGFVMALITKATMISLFYVLMIALLAGNSARKPGESRRAFESRSRRESRERTAAMVAITALFSWLSAWLCRERNFSPLGEYVSGRSQQQE
ncbi:TPA: hypothetical protein L4936_001512 [Pseudomonas aeruginosa]|nr:hypothetical protein [Pseudomonas aeruginosa]HBO7218568.1 hypothetical protein [Pseudomonas aeruginosa]